MTRNGDLISKGLDLLEAWDAATVTYTEVDQGSRTDYAGLTALVQDMSDTGNRIRRRFDIPTAALSRDPARLDQITDADAQIWTVTDTDLPVGGRGIVEAFIVQTRG